MLFNMRKYWLLWHKNNFAFIYVYLSTRVCRTLDVTLILPFNLLDGHVNL